MCSSDLGGNAFATVGNLQINSGGDNGLTTYYRTGTGSWTTGTDFPNASGSPITGARNDYTASTRMYVLQTGSGSTPFYSTTNGTSWTTETNSPVANTTGSGIVGYSGTMFATQGNNGLPTYRYNGSTWASQTSFPELMYSTKAAGIFDNGGTKYMAIWAGYTPGSSSNTNKIWYAPINP